MSHQRTPRLAALLVGAAAPVVPAGRRREWRAEWRAELAARWAWLHRRPGPPPGRWAALGLAVTAAGALPDALYLRWQETAMLDFARELIQAARALLRRPAFTLVAVVTLGLGIGANTALLAIADAVLLRPLPYADPERLVRLVSTRLPEGVAGATVSYPNLADWGRLAESLEATAGIAWWRPALTGGEEPEVLSGATVSWNLLELLGVRPAAGRFFRRQEEGEGRPRTAVIGHGLWTRRFDSDPGLIGRTVSINRESYTVVGVLPAGFELPLEDADWGPVEVLRTPWFDAAGWYRSGRSWRGVGRLRSAVGLAASQHELSAVMATLADAYPEENRGRGVRIEPLGERLVGPARPALTMLLVAVGLVLLVACANVAGLLLGRVMDRRREIAVRSALGASRWRLARQLAGESLVLAAGGGALGLAAAGLLIGWLPRLAGGALPRVANAGVDTRSVLAATALSLVAAALLGAAPALRGVRLGAAGGSSRSTTRGRGGQRLRKTLVVAQIALTVVLASGAGLLLRSLERLYRVDLGLATDGILTLELHGAPLWELDAAAAQQTYRQLAGRLEALPGVAAAGAIDIVPLGGGFSCDGVARDDLPPPAPGEGRCAEVRSVTPGIFAALGVPLLAGRLPEWSDGPGAARVAVVSAAAAAELWGGGEALGGRITVHEESFEVVGVVGDLRHFGPDREAPPLLYLPAAQEPWNGVARGLTLVVRGPQAGGGLEAVARREIAAVAGGIPVGEVRSMQRLLAGSLTAQRFRGLLLAGFAALATVLALVGVAGVIGYSAARRSREMGIRLALGADRSDVVRLVLGEGLRLTAVGVALGWLGALAAGRGLAALLFGVGPADPVVFATVPAALAAAALLAAWLPARRVSAVDPAVALRAE